MYLCIIRECLKISLVRYDTVSTGNLLMTLQRNLLPQMSWKSEVQAAGWIGSTIQGKSGVDGRLWKPLSLPEGTEKPSPRICNSSIMAVWGVNRSKLFCLTFCSWLSLQSVLVIVSCPLSHIFLFGPSCSCFVLLLPLWALHMALSIPHFSWLTLMIT